MAYDDWRLRAISESGRNVDDCSKLGLGERIWSIGRAFLWIDLGSGVSQIDIDLGVLSYYRSHEKSLQLRWCWHDAGSDEFNQVVVYVRGGRGKDT